MKVCGFHQACPYWYNGFEAFLVTPPGWYFFAFPWYLLTGSVSITLYLSIILILVLALATIVYFGKRNGFSLTKSLVFFAVIFGNAMSVGNFLRLGRVHAMLNTFLLAALFLFIMGWRKRRINSKFLLAGVLFATMIVTHYQETVLATLFLAGIFLEKRTKKERAIIITAGLVALVLSSWWFVGFVKSLTSSSLLSFHEGKRALDFNEDRALTNALTYIIPLLFIVALWLYKKAKKVTFSELVIFMPSAVLSVIYLFKVHVFLPIFRNISQDPYILFFLMQTVFLLLSMSANLKKRAQMIVGIIFVAGAVLSVSVNIIVTPHFQEHTALDEEMKEIMKSVSERYLIVGPFEPTFKTSYSKAYYSYGAIYEGISTAEGWSPPIANAEYLLEIDRFIKGFLSLSCKEIQEGFMKLNTSQTIAYTSTCKRLEECKFHEQKKTEHLCLYDVN